MSKAETSLIWAWGLFLLAWVGLPILGFLLTFFGMLDPSGLMIIGSSIASIFLNGAFVLFLFATWLLSIFSTVWFCEEMDISQETMIILLLVCVLGCCCCCSVLVPTGCLIRKKLAQ